MPHPRKVVIIQHIDLDCEVVEGKTGHIQGGCVGQAGIVPEDDAPMASARAESGDCKDPGIADVCSLQHDKQSSLTSCDPLNLDPCAMGLKPPSIQQLALWAAVLAMQQGKKRPQRTRRSSGIHGKEKMV